MLSGPPRRRPARPVADAPIDALLDQGDELAKGWLLALLEQAPLEEAPQILAADLTRDGPRLCEAVLRAIADDRDLRRLEPDGALTPLAARAGRLAGTTGPESVSRALEALQAVIWTALRDELRNPDPDLVSGLAERLTRVIELLRSAALHGGQARGAAGLATELAAVELPPRGPAAAAGAPEPPPAEPRVDRASAPVAPEPQVSPGGQPLGGDSEPERRWPREVVSAQPSQALWVEALQEEIDRSAGAPLSLLLAELEDADRVAAVEAEPEASETYSEFARAVRRVVRRHDILVSETDVRTWIIARDTGRAGARALGQRIADAVGQAHPWRGAPLRASVGVAVLGEDGRTPLEMIEAAEEARFAAAANGIATPGPVPGNVPED